MLAPVLASTSPLGLCLPSRHANTAQLFPASRAPVLASVEIARGLGAKETAKRQGLAVTGKPPVPLQTEANENEEPLARIPRSLFSAFQSGQHRCWQGYFISAIRFLHSSGSFSDHGSRSSRKSRFVSSICFGISVSRCEM